MSDISSEPTNGLRYEPIPERFPLDEPTIQLVRGYRRQIEMLNAQCHGALALFCKQHSLEGNWLISEDQQELIRIP